MSFEKLGKEELPRSEPRFGPSFAAPLSSQDWLLIALFIACLFFITWFRRHGMFWNDEIMGWMVLIQPTVHRMLQVWWSGTDSSGLLFYVMAKPWLHIFGWTELSLHLFSTLLVGLSFLVIWVCARRNAQLLTVALVAPLVYLVNRTVAGQLSNGRTYGVVLVACAVASYALLRTDPAERDFRGIRPALLSFLGFFLLTGSHTLGILFWGVFLAGFCLRDLLFRVFQWKIYLGALLALLLILPISWRNIQATINVGKPTFWTPKPTFLDLFIGFGDYSLLISVLLTASILTFLILFYRQPAARRGALVPRSRLSLYCLLAVFPFLEILMFALSLLGKSIFIDRYMIPIAIGDVLALCELLTRLETLKLVVRPVRTGLAAAGALVLCALFAFNLHRQGLPSPNYTQAFLRAMPPGEPLVVTDVGRFIEVIYYHNQDRNLLSPTDWSIQLDPGFGPGGASYLHEMENLRSVGIYNGHILSTQDLLAHYHSFVVISDKDHTLWFRRYIANNPSYQTVELPPFDNDRIWNVQPR